MPYPKPGDWLAEHPEAGQTFDDYAASGPNMPKGSQTMLYVQPLGEFPETKCPSMEALREYAAAYFAMDVSVLPALNIAGNKFSPRINPSTGGRQILTLDVLAFLKKRLPPDAFCILAITMEDLYPHPSWNFVFGQASIHERVGVFSFARYDPVFYGEEQGKDYRELLLKRSCKVLVHEMAHMFSVAHCIFFRCVMNGSNHLQESDSRPLFLCPVCLRKLQFSIGFDFANRYHRLLQFYKKVGFDHEAQWIEKRLLRISK
jgi:archaemetzincin